MPVSVLTAEPRNSDGRDAGRPSPNDLSRSCPLDDAELAYLSHTRGDHRRLGGALQLTPVRLLGTFLDDPVAVPPPAIQTRATPLDLGELDGLLAYRDHRLPAIRCLATLAACVPGLDATAHDDALEVRARLVRDRFGPARTADKHARRRTLQDLDQAATTLAGAGQLVLIRPGLTSRDAPRGSPRGLATHWSRGSRTSVL